MEIFDQEGNLIEDPDLEKGYLIQDRLLVAHHEATEAVEEVSHYEVTAEYENGGKDVKKVIDTPAAPAMEAWDEYRDIRRYVAYTVEELAANARDRRKALLMACDWTQALDAPIDGPTREAYRTYRQALRDITEQEAFPQDIVWPELPEITKAAPEPIDTCILTAYREGVESA